MVDLLTSPFIEAMRATAKRPVELRDDYPLTAPCVTRSDRVVHDDQKRSNWSAKYCRIGLHRNPITDSEPALNSGKES